MQVASSKRLLLAVYLDFLIFSAAWGVLVFALADGQPFTAARYVAFVVLEAMAVALFKWSPGYYALSIVDKSKELSAHEPGGMLGGHPVVDVRILKQESLVTLGLGVYLVLEGTKGFVRWTMWTPPQPMFGVQLSAQASIVAAMVEGVVTTGTGLAVLRLHRLALPAVPLLAMVQLLNLALSWPLLPGFIAEAQMRRREFQGLPVRPGEIEFLQKFMPGSAVALYLLQVVLAWLSKARFGFRAPSTSVG